MSNIDSIELDGVKYDIVGGGYAAAEEHYFFDVPSDIAYYANQVFMLSTNTYGDAAQWSCLEASVSGIEKVRLTGYTPNNTKWTAWVFLDEGGHVVSKAPNVLNKEYDNVIVDVPNNAAYILVSGNHLMAPCLEVGTKADRADINNLQYELSAIEKRLKYRGKFAWMPLPHALFALTFDDSYPSIQNVVDLCKEKNVPACFGAIPERLGAYTTGQDKTVADVMHELIDTVGGEVLAHGASGREIVTADNIDDKDFLFRKFIVNRHKFEDFGFDVRGTVRVGGAGNICNDPRTDAWMWAFDYGDLYGIEEPYNHPRDSADTEAGVYQFVDRALQRKTFTPLLFHEMPSYLGDLIDYIKANGGEIVTYAYAYDTYGSTEREVAMYNRIVALENSDGNGVSY